MDLQTLNLTVLYVHQQKTVVYRYQKRKTVCSYVRPIAIHCGRRYVCTMFYLLLEFVAFLIPSLPRSGQWTPRFAEIVIFLSVLP